MGARGLVHLYVGDGKGKTTAAVGLAVRAMGRGRRVLFGQFLKDRSTGELEPLERLGAEVLRAGAGGKFVFQLNGAELEKCRQDHERLIAELRARMLSGGYGLIVLDEAVDAVNCGVIAPEGLTGLIAERPLEAEVVITGRNPPPELEAVSDYHTDFICRRHPWQRGTAAREGIEY